MVSCFLSYGYKTPKDDKGLNRNKKICFLFEIKYLNIENIFFQV